ncbi:hypothetical protein FDP41_005924 [Naegleria fowleri]|uniref:tRNA-uridine aminocarboxypropyltransferase n=1 Tax=Naegleria fowleri TaxID=5763 RepID=A0A6A5BLE5_NAEFO|nr:uncharacterized protein FDP41_005924 [Naegleria fowleri]KAF0975171.1 hypothetical protein FDP41_005924 [Naegleria fowleri]
MAHHQLQKNIFSFLPYLLLRAPRRSGATIQFSSSSLSDLSSVIFKRIGIFNNNRKSNNYNFCTEGARKYHSICCRASMMISEANDGNTTTNENGLTNEVKPVLERIYNTSYKNCIDFLTEDAKLNEELGKIDKHEAVKIFPENSLQKYFVYSNLYEALILDAKTRCRYCWMINKQCLCGKLKPFTFLPKWTKNVECSSNTSSDYSLHTKKVEINLHLHFLMHKKEFHKSTNSVKILLHTDATQTAHLYIDQHEMHEAVIKNLVEVASQPGSNQFVYILFPSADSQTVAQALPEDIGSLYKNLDDRRTGFIESVNDFHFHVFVLDGTWNEARMLNRRDSFAGCRRIKIDVPTNYNYVFKLVRTGKVEGRISTLEAVTLLLKDFNQVCNSELAVNGVILKECEESPNFESSIQSIYENLNTMIDISCVKSRRHGLVEKSLKNFQ